MSIHRNQTLALVSTVFMFTMTLTLQGVVFCDDTAVLETVLETRSYVTYGKALKEQVAAGDGGGMDSTFRNSGIALDLSDNAYFAVILLNEDGTFPNQK